MQKMKRILRLAAPYVLVVICAVGLFAAGAYSSIHFVVSSIFNPKLGQDAIARLAEHASTLGPLDADDPAKAHAFMKMREDADLLWLDNLAPYLSDDEAKNACKLMRNIAERRSKNQSRYSRSITGDLVEPELALALNDALAHPKACRAQDG